MRRAVLSIVLAMGACALAHASGGSAGPIRLPFHVKQGLILIDGRVNSTPGVFLLDTGETYFRFLLNRSYLRLGPGVELYKMHVASGQVSVIERHAGRYRIVLAGTFSTNAASAAKPYPDEVVSENFVRMQENVAPRLLGAIGFAFLRKYEFTIDYRERRVLLYPRGAAAKYARGITIRFMPASPIVPFDLDIDRMQIPAYLDTAGWERLKAPARVWRHLISSGHIAPAEASEPRCVRILRAHYGAHEFDIPHTEKITASSAMLTLGYPFLRHYLSIWDPSDGTVTLVAHHGVLHTPPSSCN